MTTWTDTSTTETSWNPDGNYVVFSNQFKIYDETGTSYDTLGITYEWRTIESPNTNTEDLIWSDSSDPETGWAS